MAMLTPNKTNAPNATAMLRKRVVATASLQRTGSVPDEKFPSLCIVAPTAKTQSEQTPLLVGLSEVFRRQSRFGAVNDHIRAGCVDDENVVVQFVAGREVLSDALRKDSAPQGVTVERHGYAAVSQDEQRRRIRLQFEATGRRLGIPASPFVLVSSSLGVGSMVSPVEIRK